jgi:A/G-specific adenine glycosylase
MLQQTTVAAVRDYFHRFTTRWPRVQDLAAAEDAEVMAEWAGLGYYARARNLLKCARVVAFELGGQLPRRRGRLRALPGIGPYTAAAIASIAFDRPAPVLDGNIERVMSRLFAVTEPLPASKPELKALAARLTPDDAAGLPCAGADGPGRHDLHAEIARLRHLPADGGLRGRQGRDRRRPARQGAEEGQARAPRHRLSRPADDGAFLLETRPPSGLLGGMLGWPG